MFFKSPQDRYELALDLLAKAEYAKRDNNEKEFKENSQKAINQLLKASNNNHLEATYLCGKYFYSLGDYKQSIFYLDIATKEQHLDSMFLLANIFVMNTDFKNTYRAFKLMEFLYSNKYIESYNQLGLYYLNGIGVNADYKLAFSIFEKGALKNISDCQNQLGLCYLNGVGTLKNYGLASVYFYRACLNNNKEAFYNLASMFLNPIGLSQNQSLGTSLLINSAILGNKKAIELIKNKVEIPKNLISIKLNEDDLIKESASNELFNIFKNSSSYIDKNYFKKLLLKGNCNFLNKNGISPVMFLLSNNKNLNFYFTPEELLNILSHIDLNFVDINKKNILSYIVRLNSSQELNLSNDYIFYLIQKNPDVLKNIENDNWTLASLILRLNKEQKLNFNQEQLKFILDNSDINLANNSNWTPVHFLVRYNKEQSLNLDSSYFIEIFEKTNFSIKEKDFGHSVFHILLFNYKKNINFSNDEFLKILKLNNLNDKDHSGWNYLHYILRYNIEQSYNLEPDIIWQLIEKENIKNLDSNNKFNTLIISYLYNISQKLGLDENKYIKLLNTRNLSATEKTPSFLFELLLNYLNHSNLSSVEILPKILNECLPYVDINEVHFIDNQNIDLLSMISKLKDNTKNYILNYFDKLKINSINEIEKSTVEKNENEEILKNEKLINQYIPEINNFIGLSEVKNFFNTLINVHDINTKNKMKITSHMKILFVGNHGSGKTITMDYFSKIYSLLKYTKENHHHTVFNDFLFKPNPDFFNHTIYCKFDSKIEYSSNEEIKMLETLKQLTENTLFILSITPKELADLKSKYPKFYSMFTKVINFPDYSNEELVDISKFLAQKQGLEFNIDAQKKLIGYYNYLRNDKTINFSNVYLVKNSLVKMIDNYANDRYKNNSFILNESHIPNYEMNLNVQSLDELMKDLNSMIGLNGIKKSLSEYIALVQANKRRGGEIKTNMHFVFLGNPGTGKTTVARLLGKIYKSLGLLSSGHVVETDRSDLVGKYIGHTAVQTKNFINKAIGGILFIDEAYTLTNKGNSNDFGQEAVEILLKEMEDKRSDFAVIVAGYSQEMIDFIKTNPGLESRFTKKIVFEDYSMSDLISIFKNFCEENKFKYTEQFLHHIEEYLTSLKFKNNQINNHFGNAREIRTLFEKLLEKQAIRLAKDLNADPWLFIDEDILSLYEN